MMWTNVELKRIKRDVATVSDEDIRGTIRNFNDLSWL